jgi:dihydrofolate reductase
MMSKVIGGMTISLDGFINDRDGSVGRLYPNLAELRESEMLQESMRNTGAVVMGRRAYDMAQGDLTGYEYQVPIFVLTHHAPEQPPKGQNESLKVYFVSDGIESAIRQAKAAAGEKVVTIVGGASTTQQLLKAGLLDELQIGVMPVLLGEGQRLFAALGIEPVELEKIRVLQSGQRVDLLYRVKQAQ